MASQIVNIRNLFIPTEKNSLFIDADWAQIENRLGAILTSETFLLEAFERKEDIYKKVYGQMFGVKDLNSITKTQRQIGKQLVLGQNYDMSKYGLAKKLNCSLEEADHYIEQYSNAHPMTQAAKKHMLEMARKEGFVRTYFGRVRYIENINSKDQGLRRSAEREVWNTYIQGTAADILKMCLIRFSKIIKERGLKVRMVMPIHDEILSQVDIMHTDPWDARNALLDAMQIKLCGVLLPAEEEFGWKFGSLVHTIDQLMVTAPTSELKDKLAQSSYWSWKAEQEKKKQENPATQTTQVELREEQKVSESVYTHSREISNSGENLRVTETDFQRPAICVELSSSLELPPSFAVELSRYKREAGSYLYFVVGGKTPQVMKYSSRVSEDISALLRKIPDSKITFIT